MKERLYFEITETQREELKNHFLMNGYDVKWIADGIIEVDKEEIYYIKTILSDRDIELEEVTFELCTHCGNEVLISVERAVPCSNCGKMMYPCSMCPRTCDCCDCSY